MAEQVISPGVFTNENVPTITEAAQAPVGAAIVGPTVSGQPYIPTICTTFSDFQTKFGKTFVSAGVDYSYLTSIAAYNYFQAGGTNLLVTRVAFLDGVGHSAAESTYIPQSGSDATATTNPAFQLKTFGQTDQLNSTASLGNTTTATSDLLTASLELGSADNLRFEVSNQDLDKGTFTLTLRQGNDTPNNKIAVETYRGLTLDPNSENFISKRIGDTYFETVADGDIEYVRTNGEYPSVSKYVYVSSISNTTPDYLNADGTIRDTDLKQYVPRNCNGGFINGAAQNTARS